VTTSISSVALDVRDVVLAFGGVQALQGASFSVREGEVCGLIGPNGAGKTTLFNCISGVYRADGGSVRYKSEQLLGVPVQQIARKGIARTFQHVGLFEAMTVLENVMLGGYPRAPLSIWPSWRESNRLESIRHDAESLLDRFGLRAYRDKDVGSVPTGMLKLIELARALVSVPTLLLLDEPATGLTHTEVIEFGEVLRNTCNELGLTVLIVEHNIGLINQVADTVAVLDRGRTLATGTPAQIQANPAVIEAYLGGMGPAHA
jgi:branched-chain amino acid transport system ATP-binding protein